MFAGAPIPSNVALESYPGHKKRRDKVGLYLMTDQIKRIQGSSIFWVWRIVTQTQEVKGNSNFVVKSSKFGFWRMRELLSGWSIQWAVLDLWLKLGEMSGREMNGCGVFGVEIIIETMKVYSFSQYSFSFWCYSNRGLSKHFGCTGDWNAISEDEIDDGENSLKFWDFLDLLL